MRVKTFAHVDYHIRLWAVTQSLARAVNQILAGPVTRWRVQMCLWIKGGAPRPTGDRIIRVLQHHDADEIQKIAVSALT